MQVINIYISGAEAVSGAVESIYPEEDEIGINGVIYEMSEEFKNYLSDVSKTVELGKTYTFFIDYFGNIAYMKDRAENDYNVLLKIYQDDYDEIYYAVYMDMNGDWYTLPISDNVKIDNISYKNITESMQNIMYDDPQVVLLKKNARGEITRIDRAQTYTGNKNEEFTVKPETEYIYRSPSRSLEAGTNLIYLENNAKIIIWPTEDVKDKGNWSVESANGFFSADTAYSLEVYSPDEYMFTDLLVIKMNDAVTKNKVSKSLFVITDFADRLTDNEVLPAIMGNVGSFIDLSFVGDEEGIFDDFKAGDVVNIALNSDGRVDYIEKVFSLSDFTSQTGSMYAESTITSGIVESIDLEKERIKINSENSISYRIDPNMSVMVYDAFRNECENKTAEALKTGDKIVCRLNWGNIAEIICLED